MKRLIAFDPGELTGWATGTLHEGELSVVAFGYHPWKQVAVRFWRSMADQPYDVVIYESWRLTKTGQKFLLGSDMQSSQFIGAMKLACWTAVVVPEMVTQEPAHKSVIDGWMGTDHLPVDSEGKDHARDALRHLWYYVKRKEYE